MLGRFLPRKTNFFDYFDQQASLMVQAAREFGLLTIPGADISAHATRIKQLEHEADVIVHQCVEALHKTFITPFERNDIYQLISQMDDVIDYLNETAERIVIYRLSKMTPEVGEFIAILTHATIELQLIIQGLRKLDDIEAMRQRFVFVKSDEHASDATLRKAISHLFDTETDARTIIKWKEIYEHLENAVNRCEDISNTVEGVIIELG